MSPGTHTLFSYPASYVIVCLSYLFINHLKSQGATLRKPWTWVTAGQEVCQLLWLELDWVIIFFSRQEKDAGFFKAAGGHHRSAKPHSFSVSVTQLPHPKSDFRDWGRARSNGQLLLLSKREKIVPKSTSFIQFIILKSHLITTTEDGRSGAPPSILPLSWSQVVNRQSQQGLINLHSLVGCLCGRCQLYLNKTCW